MKNKKKPITIRTRNSMIGLGFLTPWIIGLLVFTLFPIGYSVLMSISRVEFTVSGMKPTILGFVWFEEIFTKDANFIPALISTVKFIAFSTPMILVSSIILALLLNKVTRGKGFFRALFFFPVVVVSGPVMSKLIGNDATLLIQANDYGIYQVIANLPEVISTPLLYIFDNVVLILWYSGVQILIILAGLQKINKPIYEAASIDGASGWQIFWKITFPYLRPMILLCGIYTVVDLSCMSGNDLAKLVENNLTRLDAPYSYSAALSWLYTIVVLILLGVTFLLLKERKEKQDD
ncbi:MAG: sugar ABC transporter permease [Oscillospiraceae bacterium]|nr:sugar ABC transporter permease [Oscillospiraceae bacterium]